MKITISLIDDSGKSYEGSVELMPVGRSIVKYVGDPQKRLAPPALAGGSESKGLPERILALRDAGFFSEPRTTFEVHEKVQENYYCVPNRVQMALLRLHKKRFLRKATKRIEGNEEIAYVL